MGRVLCVVVAAAAGLCLAGNETHAASLESRASSQPLNTLIKQAFALNLENYPLEALIAQRILFSRLTSSAQDLGYKVHDTMDAINLVAYNMTTNSSVWASLTPELLTPPYTHEIHQAVKGVVRDYQNHRAWLRRNTTTLSSHQPDQSKTWFSRMVDLIFSEKLPQTQPPPLPPHAVPRCFSFFSFFSTPEVDTEGLDGLKDMVTEVTETLEEHNYIEELKQNLFFNSVMTTFTFVVVEYLESIGLGAVTSVGTLLSDLWLGHEVITKLMVWIEERCFLSTEWPFKYFFPEHCRLMYESQLHQQGAPPATAQHHNAEAVAHIPVAHEAAPHEAALQEAVPQEAVVNANAYVAIDVTSIHVDNLHPQASPTNNLDTVPDAHTHDS